jgi:crossover junction endodeoxyribonuclease RuvC
MRVLGIDPGLSRCGVGVVEGPPSRPRVVRAGVIRTAAADAVAARLATLYDELVALIDQERPDAVAVERVFFNANVRTAMSVGQAPKPADTADALALALCHLQHSPLAYAARPARRNA